jgi:nicotinamide-nucleotide amidase
LADALLARRLRLVTAESCTGGLIAGACTALAGSSEWFERGMVSYSNESKTELLGVPADLIARHGAVSEEVARAMAEGALTHSHADLALAVTGIAGPTGGTPDKPVGTVYLALAAADAEEAGGYRFGGEREQIRTLSACMALDWLRRYLGARSAGTPPHPGPEY